jgi:quinol monooxygenase YgiN
MIIVAGHLRVAAADREQFVQRSGEAVRLARAAPGCHDFAVSADIVDPERVNVFERWEDRDRLKAFRGSGPNDEIGSMIMSFHVTEYEVVA